MKNTISNPTIWQLAPYSVYMVNKKHSKALKPKKDLVLFNKALLKEGISEMTLCLNGISAIDDSGVEHLISSFNEQTLHLKGKQGGHFIKASEDLKLSSGKYKTFRLYLDEQAENCFTYSDGYTEELFDTAYLDFEIENGLETDEKETYELTLRFDFLPLTFSSYFNPLRDFFKKQSMHANRLTRSFGN